jgi:hypothetical protein
VASKAGAPQGAMIAFWEGLIQAEIDAGRLDPPVDAHTLAFAIVRISESFLYADLIAGEEPDVEKAIEIVRLLLA